MDDKKTSRTYRVIRWLVRVFSPKYTIVGRENLPADACIIVGNHSQMYGPIAGELYTPGKHDIWCAGEMMKKEEVAEYAYRDFWSYKPKAVRPFYKLLSRLVGPLAELIFTNAHTIAVYHDARLLTTFRETIEHLQDGRSIVIFPEHYVRHNNIIHDFQDKFIDLARVYYKRTGKALDFVPMYLSPRLKTITYGKPIRFSPETPIAQERARVCGGLMDAITEMATSMPLHTVVPYDNIAKKQYPKNLPLEVYPHEKDHL